MIISTCPRLFFRTQALPILLGPDRYFRIPSCRVCDSLQSQSVGARSRINSLILLVAFAEGICVHSISSSKTLKPWAASASTASPWLQDPINSKTSLTSQHPEHRGSNSQPTMASASVRREDNEQHSTLLDYLSTVGIHHCALATCRRTVRRGPPVKLCATPAQA